MSVKSNDKVQVHYKGTLSTGEVFDSSEGREPLEFTMGTGQIIPGFETAVMGMEVEETKTVTIPAADAYGEHRPEMIQEIANEQLPPDLKPEVGMKLMSQTADGGQMPLEVKEVKATTFVVDANHPLAGKDLTFELTLVGIN